MGKFADWIQLSLMGGITGLGVVGSFVTLSIPAQLIIGSISIVLTGMCYWRFVPKR